MQHEIIKTTALLTDKGMLAEPGYCKKMHYIYNREKIRANPFRIKEWDFYQVTLGDYILKLTIGNISYVAEFSAELFNVLTGEILSFSRMKLLPFNRVVLPRSPEIDSTLAVKGKDYDFAFRVNAKERHLTLQAKDKSIGNIDIDLYLTQRTDYDKLVIATPFKEKGRFYLNCKENYFGGRGTVTFGERTLQAGPSTTGVLDWGRGVWPFAQDWFWGNGAAHIDGNHFAFNIGWGFGNLDQASENIFFWNGKAVKLDHLDVEVDTRDYMKIWKFKDPQGRLELELTPVYDKLANTKIGFIQMVCHQMFGYYNGHIKLEDGQVIEIKNLLAFCEHARNRW